MERIRELYHQNFKLVSYKCWSGSKKKKEEKKGIEKRLKCLNLDVLQFI